MISCNSLVGAIVLCTSSSVSTVIYDVASYSTLIPIVNDFFFNFCYNTSYSCPYHNTLFLLSLSNINLSFYSLRLCITFSDRLHCLALIFTYCQNVTLDPFPLFPGRYSTDLYSKFLTRGVSKKIKKIAP